MAGRSAEAAEETVMVGSPNVPSYHSRVNAFKYNSMKKILLDVFPRDGPGITQSEMMKSVASRAQKEVFPAKTHVWWAKCVQLDMESKHELLRDATAKPLRWTLRVPKTGNKSKR